MCFKNFILLTQLVFSILSVKIQTTEISLETLWMRFLERAHYTNKLAYLLLCGFVENGELNSKTVLILEEKKTVLYGNSIWSAEQILQNMFLKNVSNNIPKHLKLIIIIYFIFRNYKHDEHNKRKTTCI